MKVTVEMAQEVVTKLSNQYGIEAEVYEDYSGRGMFGSTVVGIVIGQYDSPVVVGMVVGELKCAEYSLWADYHDIPFKRMDSLGFNIIVY